MSSLPSRPVGPFSVTVEHDLAPETAQVLWSVYLAAFVPMSDMVAARHILSREEFDQECLNPAVTKYVVRDEEGTPWGVATLTNDLDTIPWVQPEFYQTKFFPLSAERLVYYIGLILVHPYAQDMGAAAPMMGTLGHDIYVKGGVGCFDMCAYNFETKALHEIIRKVMARNGDTVSCVTLDVQYYVALVPEAVKSRLPHLFPEASAQE